jgi:hypothetical protein
MDRIARPRFGFLDSSQVGHYRGVDRTAEECALREELAPAIASGFSENLVGQFGSQWNSKLFALVCLDHQQNPKDETHYGDKP